jgi:hypothetical protein
MGLSDPGVTYVHRFMIFLYDLMYQTFLHYQLMVSVLTTYLQDTFTVQKKYTPAAVSSWGLVQKLSFFCSRTFSLSGALACATANMAAKGINMAHFLAGHMLYVKI